MNQIATIPKKITQAGELVVMSRKDFEKLLRRIKAPAPSAKKLDRYLVKSLKELKEGKLFGPFGLAKDLAASLRSSRK